MKKTAAVFLMLLFSASAFAQESVWFQGAFDTAKAAAQKDSKPILVFYYSDG